MNNELLPLYFDITGLSKRRKKILGNYCVESEVALIVEKNPPFLNARKDVRAHELSHHTQMISTTYGAFLNLLMYEKQHQMVSFLKAITENYPDRSLLVPLNEWFKELYKDETIDKNHLSPFIKWQHINYIQSIFEGIYDGNKQFHDITNSIKFLISPIWQHAVGIDFMPNFHSQHDIEEYGTAICPDVFSKPFGASHIMEALAMIDEYFIDVIETGEINEPPFEKGIHCPKGYNSAFALFLNKFCGTDHSSAFAFTFCDTPAVMKQNLYSFALAAHLALLTPLVPIFVREYRVNSSWYALHPGWRFVQICDIIREMPVLDDQLTNYATIQNLICKKLRWATPSMMKQSARIFLNGSNSDPNTTWPIRGLKRVCHVLVETEEEPWAFVLLQATKCSDKIINLLIEYHFSSIFSDLYIDIGHHCDHDQNGEFIAFKENINSLNMGYDMITLAEGYIMMKFLSGGWLNYIATTSSPSFEDFIQYQFPGIIIPESEKEWIKTWLECWCKFTACCQLKSFLCKSNKKIICP